MKKKIIAASVAMVMVITTISFAAPALLSNVYRGSFKYLVNGVLTPLPSDYVGIVYQNRNYVPIKFAADALGADVSYDKTTNTIIINGTGGVDKTAHEAQIINLNAQIKALNDKVTKLEAEKKALETKPAASSSTVQGTVKRLNGYEIYNGAWYRIKSDGSLDYTKSYTESQIKSSNMYYNGYAYYNGDWYYVKNNGIMDYSKTYTWSEVQSNYSYRDGYYPGYTYSKGNWYKVDSSGNGIWTVPYTEDQVRKALGMTNYPYYNDSYYKGYTEYNGRWYKVKSDGTIDFDSPLNMNSLRDQDYYYNGSTYRYNKNDGYWYPVLPDGKMDSRFPSSTPPGYQYYNWKNPGTAEDGRSSDADVSVRKSGTSYDPINDKLKVVLDFQSKTSGTLTIRPDQFVIYDGNTTITKPEYNENHDVKVTSDSSNATVTIEYENVSQITNPNGLTLNVVYADANGNLYRIPVTFGVN